jgi:hypothetical protein
MFPADVFRRGSLRHDLAADSDALDGGAQVVREAQEIRVCDWRVGFFVPPVDAGRLLFGIGGCAWRSVGMVDPLPCPMVTAKKPDLCR